MSQRDVLTGLGIRPVLNAFETVSAVGGTRPRSEVLDAMRSIADYFVDLRELQHKVGAQLASLTRNEAAAVTNGASAGLILATVACATRKDPRVPWHLLLPTKVRPQEVVVQRCQMSPYVQNIRQAGVDIVEVGYVSNRWPEEQLIAAINERTAAVLYTAGRPYERFAVPLARVIAVAHKHEVPVIVDAAALVPPVHNLWAYTAIGADLVVVSGGKGLQGPQDSGLVVGRTDLLEIVHQVNSPSHGVGRAFKSSKEDIVGLLVAVEAALADNEAARYKRLERRALRLRDGLAGLEDVHATVLPDGRQGQPCPRTNVRLGPRIGWHRDELISALRRGDPRIVVGATDEDDDSIYLNPLSLTDEEVEIVIARVRALLLQRCVAGS